MILTFSGWVNGYVTTRCMKIFGVTDWTGAATASAFVYPGIVMICFVFVDVIEWLEDAAGRTPLTFVFIYGMIWMTVSVSVTYHGASVGYRSTGITSRNEISAVRKRIPAQPFYMNLCVLMPVFGAI